VDGGRRAGAQPRGGGQGGGQQIERDELRERHGREG